MPVDHVIEAMRGLDERAAIASYLPADAYARIPAVLAALPAALFTRLLKTLSPVAMVIAMRSLTALDDAELANLVQIVADTGQRKIRDEHDLARLVRTAQRGDGSTWNRTRMTQALADLRAIAELCVQADLAPLDWAGWCDEELRRETRARAVEIITENQRQQALADAELERQRRRAEYERTHAEQLAWRDRVTRQWHGAPIAGDLVLIIAERPEQLDRWSSQLHNCIRSYSSKIDIEVLAALVKASSPAGPSPEEIDRADPVVNLQVTSAHGLIEMQADQRRGLGRSGVAQVFGVERGQQILDDLIALGIPVTRRFSGHNKLTLPERIDEPDTA